MVEFECFLNIFFDTFLMRSFFFLFAAFFIVLTASLFADESSKSNGFWPAVTAEAKPGAYWWWPGSAVSESDIRWNIMQAAENNMGTLHIIPIYGVKDNEANDIAFMSPKWLDMMKTAVEEARKHGMNIDMTLGTGWCFGDPEVTPEDSSTVVSLKEDDDGKISLTLRRKAIMVKRAAPGGEGPMLDPFSIGAINQYLAWFDKHLGDENGPMPRAVYHDSYEYRADWSDELCDAFENLNGYRLQDNLDVFLFNGDENAPGVERVRRIKADYRRTLSEMHLAFTLRWTEWAKKRKLLSRNEAHGSPSNWLDVYAAADMPETEFFRNDKSPLVAKFASSAAHVVGRPLVSSESGTWVDEHYHERLGVLKVLFDGFFVSGVNHLFYHGMVYSPEKAAWPGWSFYASTQMNPRNVIWRDAKYLNEYIARTQSVLQSSKPDNDILLFWSPEETWHQTSGTVLNFSVHNAKSWLGNSKAGILATKLWNAGVTFDYISPRQLKTLKVDNGNIVAPGGNYKILLIPALPFMEPDVLQRLIELSAAGAEVCFDAELPGDVPGFAKLEQRREQLNELKKKAPNPIPSALFDHLRSVLNRPLSKDVPYLGETDLKTISRKLDDGRYYFVTNIDSRFAYPAEESVKTIDQYFRLSKPASEIVLLDPMTGMAGKAEQRVDSKTGLPEVRLQLRPNQSIILRTFDENLKIDTVAWNYFESKNRKPTELSGRWKVEFLSGGPVLPKPLELSTLKSWTENGPDYEYFSGTAKYTLTFDSPFITSVEQSFYRLNLGRVCESALVRLNGKELGCVFCEPMVVDIPNSLFKPKDNVLEIEVTNLSANRVRYMDIEGIPWKIFKDANLVNIDYKPLDASKWSVQPSGLIGPVTLD